MRYSNPWSGNSLFYKGTVKNKPTVDTDKEYQLYCKRKKNKEKILSYNAWAKRERRKGGMDTLISIKVKL